MIPRKNNYPSDELDPSLEVCVVFERTLKKFSDGARQAESTTPVF